MHWILGRIFHPSQISTFQFQVNAINLRKFGGAHSDIFYHEEHEGREDKEKSFVLFVVINNKIA